MDKPKSAYLGCQFWDRIVGAQAEGLTLTPQPGGSNSAMACSAEREQKA